MQRTYNIKGVDGIDKITMKANAVTRQGNLQGYRVKVLTGKDETETYFFQTLSCNEAIEKGYVKFIKAFR